MKIKELSQRDTGIDVRYIWRNRIRLTNTISQSFSVWITPDVAIKHTGKKNTFLPYKGKHIFL